MPKLYEISADFDRLSSMDMETDDDIAAFKELLAEVQGTFDEKAEAYCKVLANISSDIDGYDAEIERLKKHKSAAVNRYTRIRAYFDLACRQIMQDGDSRKVGTFTIRLKKNPPKCVIPDESIIPDEYKKTVVTVELNRVKDALKAGEDIPGASLVQDTTLQIS